MMLRVSVLALGVSALSLVGCAHVDIPIPDQLSATGAKHLVESVVDSVKTGAEKTVEATKNSMNSAKDGLTNEVNMVKNAGDSTTRREDALEAAGGQMIEEMRGSPWDQ